MKRVFTLLAFTLLTSFLFAQTAETDSLKTLYKKANNDTTKVNLLIGMAEAMTTDKTDSSAALLRQALQLAQQANFQRGEMKSYYCLSGRFTLVGNYPEALKLLLQALSVSQKIKDKMWEAYILDGIGRLYNNSGDYQQALQYCFKARKMYPDTDESVVSNNYLNIGFAYQMLNKLDSALTYLTSSYQLASRNDLKDLMGYDLTYLGDVQLLKGNDDLANTNYRKAISIGIQLNQPDMLSESYLGLAKLFNKQVQQDSCFNYATAAFAIAIDPHIKMEAGTLLSDIFAANHNSDSAFYYYKSAMAARDSMFNQEKVKQVQNLLFNEQIKQQQLAKQQEQYRNNIKMYALAGGLISLLIIALILWRNNQFKQKANSLLQQKNDEVQHTLRELKTAQAQLIQSEKMASLGELTAGIAHEIQNPLNFVNNFSEINVELIQELKQENSAGKLPEVAALADEIEQNLHKITHHGKRADAIVKGMLQHSRAGAGKKEPTDINALIEEDLRLSYHGFRAKEKSFHAALHTRFDATIKKIEVVPQDIGRVLLNLFNNAFFAVYQKKKQIEGNYEPQVSVCSKRATDKIEIIVKDNGTGIPQNVAAKVFQPFFTTKPTGEGTGLGLSLSYDIIKAHGGEIKVQSEEGAFTEFIVSLPIT